MKNVLLKMYLIFSLLVSILVGNECMGIFFKKMDFGKAVSELFLGNLKPIIYFLVLVFILMIMMMGLALLIFKKGIFQFKNKDSLATSNFAKIGEFSDFIGNDGLMIGKKFRLSEKKSFEHFLLVGPTGSGKSAAFFIPNLLMLPAHASVVVTDPKGELLEKTGKQALQQGKKLLIFAPFKNNTMKYNPLELCRNVTEIRELAQILLTNGNAAVEQMTGTKAGSSEWTNMATPLFSSFLIFVSKLDAPRNTISYALNLIIENDLDTMKLLMEDADDVAQKQFNIFLQSAGSEQTASSIKTVLASNLQMFTDPMVEEITSLNEIDPIALREHPTHLHIVVPEHKSSFMAPLMSSFFTQMINHLLENSSGSPVHFLLDEFANIGVLNGIDVTAAIARSRKMSLSLGIQSINQLKQRYKDAATSLLDNLKTKSFLPGLSFESAEYASKMIGFREVSTTSSSYGRTGGQANGHNISKQKRELLTPDEIRRLSDETCLIISDNRNPFQTEQIRYYKDPQMLEWTQQTLNVDEYIENLRKELDKK